LSPAPTRLTGPRAPREILADLDRVVGDSTKLSDMTRDVQAMLSARIAESDGRVADAIKEWHVALGTAEGRFGKAAFDGWVRAYTKQLAKKTDSAVLARLLLAETRGGNYSPWMQASKLTTELSLAQTLEEIVPEWIDVTQAGVKSTTIPVPPAKPGIPADDPVLAETAKRFCPVVARTAAPLPADALSGWTAWVKSLPEDVQPYWQAIVTECSGDANSAVAALRPVHAQFMRKRAHPGLALESIARIIRIRRAAGERETVADDYSLLMKTWQEQTPTPRDLGVDAPRFATRRVDETLWAARYRMLVGDVDGARTFAQQSLDLIASSWSSVGSIPASVRDELSALRAEGYHFLAYRVGVETGNLESAIALNTLALQTSGLNQEWRDRLNWFAGYYEFLAGNFESARRKWEAMIVESPDETLRATLYFWLSQTYAKLGQNAESEFYQRALVDDYPLSYYSVVAVGEVGGDGSAWSKRFRDFPALVASLSNKRDYKLDALRRGGRLSRLLARAELLVAADAENWARMAVTELDEGMQRGPSMESSPSAYVYLSRLHYVAGNFNQAIALTTQLSLTVSQFWTNWPEQLLVTFPRPFVDAYARVSADTGVSAELMLAISRQESGFRGDAQSPANAIGVMQLIRRTALSLTPNSEGLSEREIERRLLDPSTNISLGGQYLKELSTRFNGFLPAVFAGYNAGEHAVATWVAGRKGGSSVNFVELIPYGETKGYVRNVWRNLRVYEFIRQSSADMPQVSRANSWWPVAMPIDARSVVLRPGPVAAAAAESGIPVGG